MLPVMSVLIKTEDPAIFPFIVATAWSLKTCCKYSIIFRVYKHIFFVHIVLSTRVKCHLQIMSPSDKVIDIGLGTRIMMWTDVVHVTCEVKEANYLATVSCK